LQQATTCQLVYLIVVFVIFGGRLEAIGQKTKKKKERDEGENSSYTIFGGLLKIINIKRLEALLDADADSDYDSDPELKTSKLGTTSIRINTIYWSLEYYISRNCFEYFSKFKNSLQYH
jgi:hypothetical protein